MLICHFVFIKKILKEILRTLNVSHSIRIEYVSYIPLPLLGVCVCVLSFYIPCIWMHATSINFFLINIQLTAMPCTIDFHTKLYWQLTHSTVEANRRNFRKPNISKSETNDTKVNGLHAADCSYWSHNWRIDHCRVLHRNSQFTCNKTSRNVFSFRF